MSPSATNFAFILLVGLLVQIGHSMDVSYCRANNPEPDRNGGFPLIFMGRTWDTEYWITISSWVADFSTGALRTCHQFNAGLEIATIKTPCQYKVISDWFRLNFPTSFDAWIGGMRFGNFIEPRWVAFDEEIYLGDLDGRNASNLPGPYYPGGYAPEAYPEVNCLTMSRNCPQFTGAHQNPCTQTPNYPDLEFYYADCRDEKRIICQRPYNGP